MRDLFDSSKTESVSDCLQEIHEIASTSLVPRGNRLRVAAADIEVRYKAAMDLLEALYFRFEHLRATSYEIETFVKNSLGRPPLKKDP